MGDDVDFLEAIPFHLTLNLAIDEVGCFLDTAGEEHAERAAEVEAHHFEAPFGQEGFHDVQSLARREKSIEQYDRYLVRRVLVAFDDFVIHAGFIEQFIIDAFDAGPEAAALFPGNELIDDQRHHGHETEYRDIAKAMHHRGVVGRFPENWQRKILPGWRR